MSMTVPRTILPRKGECLLQMNVRWQERIWRPGSHGQNGDDFLSVTRWFSRRRRYFHHSRAGTPSPFLHCAKELLVPACARWRCAASGKARRMLSHAFCGCFKDEVRSGRPVYCVTGNGRVADQATLCQQSWWSRAGDNSLVNSQVARSPPTAEQSTATVTGG